MMSRLHVRLQIQFPYFKVLILGVIISLLGLSEVVIGILAFTHKIWGHYLGTGLWCGIIIFISGICAVTASQIRAPICAKLYFATAVIGVLVSFVMVILSSGGLDYDSDFYHFHHFDPSKHVKKHNSTVTVHGLSLGLSIGSFLLNIVSVIICMKYVVFDKKIKYTTERTTRKTTNSLERCALQGGSSGVRSSTCSRAPLTERSPRRSRSRRSSDQGTRRRSEPEECTPGGSRPDSTRRNKERRRRRGERRDTTNSNRDRDRSSRNEQARNQRNEIPVPVQVERMTIYDGVTQADVVHNDLLPTHFNEDELPPYEEAIRDTYVPVSDINNQILTNNVHNDSLRTNSVECIHVCDIDDSKIYQNIDCCNVNEVHHSASSVPPRRGSSARDRPRAQHNDTGQSENVNINSSNTSAKTKPSDRVKYVQGPITNDSNEEIELYVNQSALPKVGKSGKGQGKTSTSTSALCDNMASKDAPARRCASTASSVSLPPANPPLKPPKFHAGRTDLREILDSSTSDSSLGLSVKQDISNKTYVNINDASKSTCNGCPKLSLLKVDSGPNCRIKNSRYKADYIQLQIRQDPEGSSSVGDIKRPVTEKSGNELTGAFASSSGSNKTSNAKIRSSNPPNDLSLIHATNAKKNGNNSEKSSKSSPKTALKEESQFLFDSTERIGSLSTPSSPASLDLSGFSPVRFGSPTSAFKPYKRDSTSSGLTSPLSDSDVLISPTRNIASSATLPLSSEKTIQRQPSWKEFMLPSSHCNTDQKNLMGSKLDSKKLSTVVSQPSKVELPNVSLNTFPRPTPPKFVVPSGSSKHPGISSGPHSSTATHGSGVKLTSGATQSVGKDSFVLPRTNVFDISGHPFGSIPVSYSTKSLRPTLVNSNAGVCKSSIPGTSSSKTNVSMSKSSGAKVTSSQALPGVHSVAVKSDNLSSGRDQPGSSGLSKDSVSGGQTGPVHQRPGNDPLQVNQRQGREDPLQLQPLQRSAQDDPLQVNQSRGSSATYPAHNDGNRGLASASAVVNTPRQGQQQQQPQQPPPQQQRQQQQGKPLFSILL